MRSSKGPMHLLMWVGSARSFVPRVSRPSTRHPNAPALKGVKFSSIIVVHGI